MTIYTHDPRITTQDYWPQILRHSNDPVVRVGALLILSDGREFSGANSIDWDAGLASMEWVWKLNRDVGRGLVRHAETSAILKSIDLGVTNFLGATLIVSLSPCDNCRKLIEACGIGEVYFGEIYVPSGR